MFKKVKHPEQYLEILNRNSQRVSIVSLEAMRSINLTAAPPGATFDIIFPETEAIKPNDDVRISRVEVVNSKEVLVTTMVLPCAWGWNNAMRYKEFCEAVNKTLKRELSALPEFSLVPISFFSNDTMSSTIINGCQFRVLIGTIADMEKHVQTVIDPVLRPIREQRIAMDAPAKVKP